MNSILKICLFLIPIALWSGAAVLAGQPVTDGILSGEAIVRVRSDATIEQFLKAFNRLWPGTTVTDSIPEHSTYRLQLPPEAQGIELATIEPQLQQFVHSGANPVPGTYLTWAELNWLGEAPEGRTGSIVVTSILGPSTFDSQYPVSVLDLTTAHQISTGAGTVVAVLDTGVDPAHPELAGRVMSSGYNFITNSSLTADLGDAIDNDGDGLTDEMVGHGTFVAGLVALVAPDAKILPIVVLDSDGVGDSFEIAKGMYYAIDHGVEVINMSLGSTYKSSAVEDATDYAKSLGIPVVSAGGNQNVGESYEEFPAAGSDGFGVAAVGPDDVRADFSNYNDKFFISAPGTSELTGSDPGDFNPSASIISTLPGGGYGAWEGTSFATPLVAGTVALVRSQYPHWTLTDTGPLTLEGVYESIEHILASSAVNINAMNPGYAGMLGAGRLDSGAAVSSGPIAPPLGDLNGDGIVDQNDVQLFFTQWARVHSSADLDGDGVVGQSDYDLLIANWTDGAPPVPGDLVDATSFLPPGDGRVNGADLAFLISEWGANPGSPADMVTSATLRLPPDGIVNGADLAWLISNWAP